MRLTPRSRRLVPPNGTPTLTDPAGQPLAEPVAARKVAVPLKPVLLATLGGLVVGGIAGASGGSTPPEAARSGATATVTVTRTADPVTRTLPAITRTVTKTVKPARQTVLKTVSAPVPLLGGGGGDDVYYGSCSEARDAGDTPLYRDDPGYRTGLDRDNDGIACE